MKLFSRKESEADAIERQMHEKMMALRQQERERKLRRGRSIASAIRWSGYAASLASIVTFIVWARGDSYPGNDVAMWVFSAFGAGLMVQFLATTIERQAEEEHGDFMEVYLNPYYTMDTGVSMLFFVLGAAFQLPLLYGFVIPLLKLTLS